MSELQTGTEKREVMNDETKAALDGVIKEINRIVDESNVVINKLVAANSRTSFIMGLLFVKFSDEELQKFSNEIDEYDKEIKEDEKPLDVKAFMASLIDNPQN